MNDITSSSPTASPPSSSPAPSAPSSPPEPTPTEELAKYAMPEDATEYVEQRQSDEGQIERDATPAQRNYNRHQRQRKVIEKLTAELAAQKAEAGPRDDGTPDGSEQTAADQPTYDEQQQGETREQYEERIIEEVRQSDARREHAAEFRARQRALASTAFPDFHEVIANAPQHEIPQAVHDQILASPVGPILQYGLAHPAGQADFVALLNASPKQQERMIMKWEAMIEANMQQRPAPQYPQQQPRRVTQARKPITPLRGSAGPSRSTADLAENMDAYARQRLREMKTKRE